MSFRKKETDAVTGGAIGAAAGLAIIAVVVALLQIPAKAQAASGSQSYVSATRP